MSEAVLQHTSAGTEAELGAGPLVFNFPLTPDVTIQTTVLGAARNIAAISILNGSITMWSTTLQQTFPEARTTFPLQIGDLKIDAGADFKLTIPTETRLGQVVFSATLESNGVRQPFAAQVSSWPLSSSL